MGHFAEALSLPKLCQTKSALGSHQYTNALRATIGWMYRTDPAATDVWGLAIFTPMVMRAHDILLNEHG